MQKLPLINGVIKYINEGNLPFTMPGHKSGRGYLNTEEGKKIINNILKYDITEVDGVDNLHNAEGILKESQQILSEFYGSYKSYYLVNGSTSGNLAMIYSTFNKGDKIILERNCHRSIFNAVIMRELKPIYLRAEFNKDFSAPFSLYREDLLRTIQNNKDAKGIVITYPNYYGICIDLSIVLKEAKKYNMKVLVDCAHGAHFGTTSMLPMNPIMLGADMVVMSSHKTLASLTQTAYLHVNNSVDLERVDFYVSAFMSTSPSYILMMSMEYGRFFLQEYGKEYYEEYLKIILEYRDKINFLNGFRVIGKEHMYKGKKEVLDTSIDLSRLVINIDTGYNAYKLLDYLRKSKIQGEMSDGRNVILIPNVFNDRNDFDKLYCALSNCKIDTLKEDKKVCSMDYSIPKSFLLPYEVMESEKEFIDIGKAVGRVCGKAIVPYPPGVPLLMPGEVISDKEIDVIYYYINNKSTILGIDKEKILVVK